MAKIAGFNNGESKINLIYVPQMNVAVDYFKNSNFYNGENIIPLEDYLKNEISGRTIILGREGTYHHESLDYIELLKQKGLVSDREKTSLVLFDNHTDLKLEPSNSPLNQKNIGKFISKIYCGNWVGFALYLKKQYGNAVIIGPDPIIMSELLPKFSNIAALDKTEIYVGTPNSPVDWSYFKKYKSLLKNNKSVENFEEYYEGVHIIFKDYKNTNFNSLKKNAVIDIDLDVLPMDELKASGQFFQGIITTEELVKLMGDVPKNIEAVLICGLTENQKEINDTSLDNLSKIINQSSKVISK